MLLLGVVQAQASGGAPAGVPAYDLLATEILTGNQASVTFSSLGDYASTYQHLQLRYVGRADNAQAAPVLRFNADTTFTNYRAHLLKGDGQSVTSAVVQDSNRTGMQIPSLTNSSAPAGAFGAGVIDILDPFETSKYTTIRSIGGDSGDEIQMWSGLWLNTASLTSVTFTKFGGSGGYATGSRFSLYGWKAA